MKTILFVPVSGPLGSGELMRSLIIARELRRAEPDIAIHFLVSRMSPLRGLIEFEVHDCDASPTLSTPQVLEVLEKLRPNVVVFDSAGRTRQLRVAHALGARIVFMSRTPRLRRKAFRMRWMRHLSEHWIVSPRFILGAIGLRERLMSRLFPRVTVRFLDALYRPSEPAARAAFMARHNIGTEPFTLFLPGGGGPHPEAVRAAELFVDAAHRLHQASAAPCFVLTGSDSGTTPVRRDGVVLFPTVHSDDVQHLIHAATLIVCNGGSSMLHALVQSKPVIAVRLRNDQARRIRIAARLGVVAPASADAEQIAGLAADLWQNPHKRRDMAHCLDQLELADGLPIATQALRNLLAREHPPMPAAPS